MGVVYMDTKLHTHQSLLENTLNSSSLKKGGAP